MSAQAPRGGADAGPTTPGLGRGALDEFSGDALAAWLDEDTHLQEELLSDARSMLWRRGDAAELARQRKLLEGARKECMQHKWEEALELFTHALAVSEKVKASSTSSDPGGRGTLVHNIAFCLHCMGEFEAARGYYEQSLECFKKVTFPLHQKVINGLLYPERLAYELAYGGLNHNRIQMTKERLLDISSALVRRGRRVPFGLLLGQTADERWTRAETRNR